MLRSLVALVLLIAVLAGCSSGGGNTQVTPDNATSAPNPSAPTQPSGE